MTPSTKITNLVNFLNVCRQEYYNNNNSPISDEEYDKYFDELKQLEEQTGIILSNSPTQQVGYTVMSSLPEVEHKEPLLSLDKTKTYEGVITFCKSNPVLFMHKLDGLTVQITYEDGKLVRAETRGDGFKGEDITHNIRTVGNVPITIKHRGTIRVTGEVIVRKDNFDRINSKLTDEEKYKSPRNFASGSLRQLDNSICAKRCLEFIVWNANDLAEDNTMLSGLLNAVNEGFTIVHTVERNIAPETTQLENLFDNMRTNAINNNIPIDGIVIMFNNISYGKSLGRTSHHFRNGLAFKFYDEGYTTVIRNIEYTIGKTGVLTPTAVFDPVDMDGVTVTRASVHNISILEQLNIAIGDEVEVYRANDVIPQIRKNNTKHNNGLAYYSTVPDRCPYCGEQTGIAKSEDSGVKTLVCTNSECNGVLLKRFSSFVSRNAMDIEGLSDKTLEKFIALGYLKKYSDIYEELPKHWAEISKLDGFGEKSVTLLQNSIEKSKSTTFDRFIMSLNIDGIGSQNAKELAKQFENNIQKFRDIFNINNVYAENTLSRIRGFGNVLVDSIVSWFADKDNITEFDKLCNILKFNTTVQNAGTALQNMKFVITGLLTHFPNRESLVQSITSNGGTVQSGVNKETNYLINNDINSTSSKNKKAKDLNIPIITEEQFLTMLKGTVPVQEVKPKKKSLF